jgi:phospholipase C
LLASRAAGNDAAMERRDFLKAGAVLGGAVALGGCRLLPIRPTPAASMHSILDGAPADSGIDTIVMCMMENRSFDSYLGWLARDQNYLARGRSNYGATFAVNGQSSQQFAAPDGTIVDTYRRIEYPDADPWRACGHLDPGHSWNAGRAQRDHGFLANGSGNDIFALGYFEGDDLSVYEHLARRFLVFDDWHASLLGPTYPNREYYVSAQSGGNKTNAFAPAGQDGWQWDTIVDRLRKANVSVADYASDFPTLALWGSRMTPVRRSISDYYEDAAAGNLPHVSYVEPSFIGANQCDDHPLADPRAGQRFIRDIFRAFARSPQWHNGLFVVTYDEWGGFFDHVAPPVFLDDRANTTDDQNNFGQAGFRVPTIFASPRALPGAVDHARYDHTAVLRFIQWRFLGAPPRGPSIGPSWSLTARDRNSKNPGEMLSSEYFDPDLYFDPNLAIPEPSAACGSAEELRAFGATTAEPSPWLEGIENGYWERVGVKIPAGVG